MESKTWIQKSWPYILAALVIILLNVIFFAPQFQGKTVQPSDTINNMGMYNEVLTYYKKTGDESLWTNSMFSGMPTYHIFNAKDGTNFITYLTVPFLNLFGIPLAHFIMGMLAFFISFTLLGMNIWVALIGSVAFGFSTNHFLLAAAGHDTKLGTIAFFPMIAAGIFALFRNRLVLGGILFTLGLTLNIINNHIQMSYYLMLILLPYFIIESVYYLKKSTWLPYLKIFSILIIGSLIAIGSSATRLWLNYDYAKDTMRGGTILSEATANTSGGSQSSSNGLGWDYAMQWSHGTGDLIATIIPSFVGGSSDEMVDPKSALMRELRSKGANVRSLPTYWGALPFTGGPDYQGIILMAIFLLGLFLIRGHFKWWVVFAAVFVLLQAMGKNFEILNKFLFDYFPMYNKFRAPSSIMLTFSFIVALFSSITLHHLITKSYTQDQLKKAFYYSFGSLGAILLLFLLLGSG
ncbi:MAG: hypothetical protein M3Q56_05265, partial [Bacteroidota bacterium]|nr:hypothetical protein [Bacteroidota bacterium]